MANAAEREGRLCLFVARSAFSLALQALHGTPQSEWRHHMYDKELNLNLMEKWFETTEPTAVSQPSLISYRSVSRVRMVGVCSIVRGVIHSKILPRCPSTLQDGIDATIASGSVGVWQKKE
ncbi:hypothetical protein Zmor_006980 [Zophobas morio]|uniref:Uncharacterized protein n=1 Tax=Zophobas morio TaxID=2755281 RepID=A0AA38IWI6_9CUCU|nr:hypothetical protein Zmor_006980 [Zophobas morio]